MGWSSGVYVFDEIVDGILKDEELSFNKKVNMVKTVAIALAGQDWDTETDSRYYDNPIVKKVFFELYGWEDDE